MSATGTERPNIRLEDIERPTPGHWGYRIAVVGNQGGLEEISPIIADI